ncbi:Aste57867_3308 [Aphanomyces stellatus]|uniref:Aste57867_3308 protein n=1 Tax=Aphanomyces stellatus TaxID=120398 RepID=A0A485KB50_9STRA|nr:hypothetical protein As57867_003298 [Aphanomyces stellatus]VFT80478.1 Aste57867_3308 [Aphanomyces stellatus]
MDYAVQFDMGLLGMRLHEWKGTVRVGEIKSSGQAAMSGQVSVGDTIMAVNELSPSILGPVKDDAPRPPRDRVVKGETFADENILLSNVAVSVRGSATDAGDSPMDPLVVAFRMPSCFDLS